MHAAVMAAAPSVDVVVMAAAVADYAPSKGAATEKMEKGGPLTITLERTVDILAALGEWRGSASRPVLVGFAAQTGDPVPGARRKLQSKSVDLIVANDVTAPGAGFDVDTNEVTLVGRDATEHLPLMPKSRVAGALLDRIEQMLHASVSAPAAQ
jgi:phosphopantothenoylcysteine decarboxylase/phosphopantothenate--cysteine ligase